MSTPCLKSYRPKGNCCIAIPGSAEDACSGSSQGLYIGLAALHLQRSASAQQGIEALRAGMLLCWRPTVTYRHSGAAVRGTRCESSIICDVGADISTGKAS